MKFTVRDDEPFCESLIEDHVRDWMNYEDSRPTRCDKCRSEPCICTHLKKFNGRRRNMYSPKRKK